MQTELDRVFGECLEEYPVKSLTVGEPVIIVKGVYGGNKLLMHGSGTFMGPRQTTPLKYQNVTSEWLLEHKCVMDYVCEEWYAVSKKGIPFTTKLSYILPVSCLERLTEHALLVGYLDAE